MAVKVDNKRDVSNWCLADWLFDLLPAGTYYLTLVTDWKGPHVEKPQIGLIKEMPDGRLSGMLIEGPASASGLRSFAENHGFQPTDEEVVVFVLKKQ